MDFQDILIESYHSHEKSSWRAAPASLLIHGLILAFIAFMSLRVVHKVQAEKPIRAYLVTTAAAPPPPPPPPPPAGSSAPKSTPIVKPLVVPHKAFVQPQEIPKEVPPVTNTPAPANDDSSKSDNPAGVPGGVEGGVEGGVVGGQVGGVLGGQLGGVPGGQVGGTPGGTGDAKPAEAPAAPTGPLRVGGDVKAPVTIHRVDPTYPDVARKARTSGVVIVEAIIDKDGNVDQVKVLKGLPMGLSEAAEAAVKQWKFKPGTLNGEPVEVIFNLTVNFSLQ